MASIAFLRSFLSFLTEHFATLALLAGLTATACPTTAAAPISESAASQAGLTRAWFGQVALDVSQHKVIGAELEEGRLFVLSNAGLIQAFDAETGQTIWSERIGKASHLTYGPIVRGDLVAVVNGITLYLLDGATGNEIGRHRFRSAPTAAPAIGKKFIFIPMTNSRIEGIPLDSDSKIRWSHAFSGNAYAAPIVIADRVLWASDHDFLYGAFYKKKGVRIYRFQASGRLLAPATSLDKTAFIATKEGYLYAIHTEKGKQLWRASIGVSVNHPALALPGRIFVGSEAPALHAIDPESGAERWTAQGVRDFVAASAQRVYAVSPRGELSVLDAQTGRIVAHVPGVQGLVPLPNDETDRLYFISRSGLVQCLHETGAKEPRHHMAAAEAAENEAEVVDSAPADETPFDVSEEPFVEEPADEPAEAEEPADDPFGADPFGDSTEEEPVDEDDPFAF